MEVTLKERTHEWRIICFEAIKNSWENRDTWWCKLYTFERFCRKSPLFIWGFWKDITIDLKNQADRTSNEISKNSIQKICLLIYHFSVISLLINKLWNPLNKSYRVLDWKHMSMIFPYLQRISEQFSSLLNRVNFDDYILSTVKH